MIVELPEGVTASSLQAVAPDRFVRLRSALGVSSFGINQMVLEPGERNRIHRHSSQEEVYLVLEGVLTLLIEGQPFDFGSGELVRVAPNVRRQLVNLGPRKLSLLALGGIASHNHEPRDAEAFGSWDDAEPGTPQTVPVPEDLPASELR
jgi:quercetin dioxygenase-like cupin family protein